jgi:O-antigen/teichoic acid export membrane protein
MTVTGLLKTKIFKDTVFLNLATMVGQVFKVLQGFLILKFLDPAAYGIWLSLEIIIKYSAYSHLGLEYGLNNRLPYYAGKEKGELVQEMKDTSYFAWTVLASLFTIAILIYSFNGSAPSSIYKWGLVIIALLILSEQQITFLSRLMTAGKKDFSTFSRLQVIKTIITFCLIVPLAYFFNVGGLMAGTLLTSIIMAVIWWKITDFRYQKRATKTALKELFEIGFPILLSALGGLLIETVDRLLILNWLGTEQLGFYGVTVLGGSFMYGFLAQAGSTMFPHIIEELSRNEDDFQSLHKYLIKPTFIFASASVLIILALVFVIPVIVTYWVPKYLPGLPAFYFFIPGYFFLSIILSAGNIMQAILVAKKRLRLLVYFQLGAVIVEVLVGILLLINGFGIAGVALSSTLAYAFYGIIVLSMAAFYVLQTGKEKFLFLVEVFSLFIAGLVLFFIIRWIGTILGGDHLIYQAIIQLLCCGLVAIPMLVWLNRRVKIMSDILPLIANIRAKIRSFSTHRQ